MDLRQFLTLGLVVPWAQCSGGLNAGLSFWLPLDDLGAGAVNTTPNAASGDPTATFVRATPATTILSNGLIGSVGSGVARSCYSPAGIYLGYLAEEARTNLCLQSADIATTWTLSAATIGTAIAGPDGTIAAKKIQEDNTTAVHGVLQVFTKAASSLAYTATFYFKQSERTWAFIGLDDGTNSSRAFYNLATGAVGSTATGGAGFTVTAATITPAGNGFYRCSLSITSSTSTTLRLLVNATTGDTVTSYLGTTGSGVYAWGGQLEQAAFATSYIPTTTVAVTRNADALTYPSAGNAALAQGSMYAEWSIAGAAGLQAGILAINDGSSNNRVDMRFNGVSAQSGFVSSGGVGQVVYDSIGTLSVGVTYKSAQKWSATDARNFVGPPSVQGGLKTMATPPASFTVIRIGTLDAGGNALNGTIRNVRIWDHALADSQLVSLTS